MPSQSKDEVLDKIKTELENLKGEDQSFDYSLEVLQFGQGYLTNPKDTFVQILHNQ